MAHVNDYVGLGSANAILPVRVFYTSKITSSFLTSERLSYDTDAKRVIQSSAESRGFLWALRFHPTGNVVRGDVEKMPVLTNFEADK